MQKSLLSFLVSCFLLLCFSQDQRPADPSALLKDYKKAERSYWAARELSNRPGNDSAAPEITDSAFLVALSQLHPVAQRAEKTGYDSLLFFTKIKTGYIYYFFDSIRQAREQYRTAIGLKMHLPSVPDSFLFTPYLFTGTIFYRQNQFDSALYYFKQAEQLLTRYTGSLQESSRLFNMIGVMHYESGNYNQSRNYFEKAISVTDPSEQELLINYKINIASLLVKMEAYDEAKKLYTSLLASGTFESEIYHNLAIINIKELQFKKALDFLRRVSYNNKKSIDLYYNMSAAFSALNETDSAEFYMQRALAENLRWNGRRKNVQYGILLKHMADELSRQDMFKEATVTYQQAILQWVTGYHEADPYHNPDRFSGAFSYINLFHALNAKAACFEEWYQVEKNTSLLEAAVESYTAAFRLADHVEKTYDSDEARLFLGKIKYSVHSKPIKACLLLYELTQKRKFLEQAYYFDQQNKASLLTLNVTQQALRGEGGGTDELVKSESEIKSSITRLSIRAMQVSDSLELNKMETLVRDKEIELARIREKLNEDPFRKQRMSYSQIPPVSMLQKNLDRNSALLSYHLSENELLIILVTQGRFEYFTSLINKNFFQTIDTFKNILHGSGKDQRYKGSTYANRLFEKLFEPVYDKLIQINRLIIIPDDELHYLPFEALEDNHKNYLVERFAIQYQYSTALLNQPVYKKKDNTILSFAPFTQKRQPDSTGTDYTVLPFSGEEIKDLPGTSYKDQAATKENFLQQVNHYGTLHLATHAHVDNANPEKSFISFYPGNEFSKLYAPEIANLYLDTAKLVILSACETGSGKLIKGEGLLSLSRAFAYAGCPDIITSLWKAEDRTTAFLTRQLHYYLGKNYTHDKALQQAKLDLLQSEQLDPRFKNPSHWAHLVFVGNYEPRHHPANWWWIALAFIIGALAYKLSGKKKTV